jgi:predicted nucleotidyltransferase
MKPPPHDPALSQFVKLIQQAIPAERIVLFGSRARGMFDELSDYDLLVVVADQDYRTGMSVKLRRKLDVLPYAKDLIVAKHSSVERQAAVPGTALYEALQEGITLYAAAQA